MRRNINIGLAIVLPIALVLAVGGYVAWAAKQAEPVYSGGRVLRGLSAPVSIRFGPHAVPSIAAASIEDMLFAQGYVVASERMWQMDLMRRLASGRLAEVLGEPALGADRFFRTVGLARAAKAGLDALGEPFQRYLRAYAAGVNAYRSKARGRLPIEYRIAGFEPAPWRPEDSLAIGEYMAWLLSFNVREELVYLRLAARLGPRRVLELFPTDEGIPAPAYARDLPAYAEAWLESLDRQLALPARWGLPTPGAASNSWAVTGRRTADGRALLANDPHLSPTMPSIWYELELRAPGFHAAGIALPGVPLVLIGHNADLAWGFTTTMADTQDIFVERPTADGSEVLGPEGTRLPIRSRTEEIRVKGRSEPVPIRIRNTDNGVIVNDILGRQMDTPMDLLDLETPYLLALRTNFEVPDRSLRGIFRLNTATTLAAARTAALDLVHASQNLMVAHRNGGIAWQVSGLLPLRGRGLGTFPVPGWKADYGWRGYVPQTENPGLQNPPDERLITANNRTLPIDSPVHVTRSWMAPYRARRIRELLDAGEHLTAGAMARMQLDRVSLEARRFLHALRRVAPQLRTLDPAAWRIAEDHLLDWDGDFTGDSASAALFVLLRAALFEALFGDELGADLPALLSIAVVDYNALEETMYSGESSFWDDLSTPQEEGPAQVWARAIHSAWAQFQHRFPHPDEQRLDRLRQLRFPHAFDRVPLLGRLFGVGPIGVAGDTHTINVMKASPVAPEKALFVPSYRAVFTPGNWPATRGTQPLGQSGHRLSPYRTDQLDDWLAGRTHPWPWGGPAAGTEIGTLMLMPTPGNPRKTP